MAYLADLLVRKVFRTISISFLYVGHTHEDIDQLFSRIAVALRKIGVVAPTTVEFSQIIANSFTPPPQVITLKSLANVSEGVEGMVRRFPRGIMKYKQFCLSMSSQGFPRLSCRVHPHGLELFRGMDGNDMFTRIYDEHVGPWQGIDYTKIPPAQRKEPPLTDADIDKYKKTITKAHKQWKLTETQVLSLVEMLNTLANDDPLPFHWTTESILVKPRLEAAAVQQPRLEAAAMQQPLGEADDDDDDSESDLINQHKASFDVWNQKQTALHAGDPLLPFKIRDLVAVNNGNAQSDPDPFFLAEIVSIEDPPDWADVAGAEEGDWLVQIRWYDRSGVSKKKNQGWTKSKYERQNGDTQLEWIPKKSMYTVLEQGLTSTGHIRKSDHKNILFYLKHPELAREAEYQDQCETAGEVDEQSSLEVDMPEIEEFESPPQSLSPGDLRLFYKLLSFSLPKIP